MLSLEATKLRPGNVFELIGQNGAISAAGGYLTSNENVS